MPVHVLVAVEPVIEEKQLVYELLRVGRVVV